MRTPQCAPTSVNGTRVLVLCTRTSVLLSATWKTVRNAGLLVICHLQVAPACCLPPADGRRTLTLEGNSKHDGKNGKSDRSSAIYAIPPFWAVNGLAALNSVDASSTHQRQEGAALFPHPAGP